MDKQQRLRVVGFCGITGGMIWFLQTVIGAAFFPRLDIPGSREFTISAVLATGCLVLVLLGFWGIWWGGGLGGRFGKLAFGGAVLGYGLMVVGGVLTILAAGPLTDPETAVSLIYLLGRLIAVICTLLTGIAVVLARRWQSWTRFAPLLLGLWPIVGEVIPAVVTGSQPHPVLNAAWGLCSAVLGLAIVAQTPSAQARGTTVARLS